MTFALSFAAQAAQRSTAGFDSAVATDQPTEPTAEHVTLAVEPTATGARLTWRGAGAPAGATFVVEHGRDAVTFTEVARVSGRGTGAAPDPFHYDYVSPGGLIGTHYFRLRRVGRDGRSVHSEVVVVGAEGQSTGLGLRAFVVGETLQVATDDPRTLRVVDRRGRPLRELRVEGGLATAVDISDLHPGVYAVTDGETSVRFIR